MQNRIETAIEFLKDNHSFLVGDLRLSISEFGGLLVTGWSQCTDFRSLSKDKSIEELNEIKALFGKMLESSPKLKKFIINKHVVYNLDFDDYGKVSIAICSEENGQLKWHIKLK